MIQALKNTYGPKCSGVSIDGNIMKINVPLKKMSLCKALSYSFDIPISVNRDNLLCLGARRSLGFEKKDRTLAKRIARDVDIPVEFAEGVMEDIPRLRRKITSVHLGITEEMEEILKPDLYVLYLKPGSITDVMQKLARREIQVAASDSLFMSICGSVITGTVIKNRCNISFACPESRISGGVDPDEAVLGIPADIARYIL